MMIVPMENSSAPSSREHVKRLYAKNIELENGLRKSAQSKVPSDPNVWLQMRENYEAIILEDHDFSERHGVEFSLWQLHYRRIEEFRAHINAVPAAAGSNTAQSGKALARPDRIKKIRSIFKSFLSEATGFYHELIQKIRAKYGLPFGYFSEGPESQAGVAEDEKKSAEVKKGLLSCHRCLIYLGDLARYKGLYGEGDSVSRDYATASGYYTQAASLCPSSGNPHHQLAILASYNGDELMAVYRYFRSLAAANPFTTARDNLIIAFEKNRQSYSQLPGNAKINPVKPQPARTGGRGRGRGDIKVLAKDTKSEVPPSKEKDLSIPEILKAFSTRFVRLNGILFTRTSLETFEEIFSSVIADLCELLSVGPEEQLNFGSDASENGLVVVRLIAILIFTVQNVNRESEGPSYAEILQRSVLLQNAFTAAFEFAGHIVKRCTQLDDASSSYLLPGILVFMEWLASHPDIVSGDEVEEKRAMAISFFWGQCVTFMNKLLLGGFVSIEGAEGDTCFFDMSRYDEGETGNRLALREDFELRGFLPLAPAQLILDFSSKHSFGSDGGNKEKKSRIERIVAAGRALINVVRVDQQGVYFDSKLKKFVIGTEPLSSVDGMQIDLLECNGIMEDTPAENSADFGSTLSNTPSYIGGEDVDEEDEVIVFKPTAVEKFASAPKSAAYEIIPPVQNSSAGDLRNYHTTISPLNMMPQTTFTATSHVFSTAANTIQQPMHYTDPSTSNWIMENKAFISDGLNNLSINGNVHGAKSGLREGFNPLQSTAYSLPFSVSASAGAIGISSGQIKALDTMVPSELDTILPLGTYYDGLALKHSAALPANTKKNPVSRPVRHFGPPPGFSPVPPKQPTDATSGLVLKDHLPLVDDYSWLDGYQPSSTKSLVTEKFINQTVQKCPEAVTGFNNSLASAINFPFPGKQIPPVQAEVDSETRWRDYQLLENMKPYSEQQLQVNQQLKASIPEQYQAQWPNQYFV